MDTKTPPHALLFQEVHKILSLLWNFFLTNKGFSINIV